MQLPAATLARWRLLRLPGDARAAPQPGSAGLRRPDPPAGQNHQAAPRDDRAARPHCRCPEQRPEQHIGYRPMALSPMALSPMALKKILILEEPAPAKAGDASALIRRPLIPVPPVFPPKQTLTEFARESRHLAPLAGRGRKLRITRLPVEGQLPPHRPAPRNCKGPLTPALSPPAGRGSTPRPRPVFPAPPVFPAQAGTQGLPLARTGGPQSRPVAPSPRSGWPHHRPIEITHGSDPQTRQET
jgi:hypothetical protein